MRICWEEAERQLNATIVKYICRDAVGSFRMQYVLLPLKRRLDGGERTESLFDEIMKCE